LSTIRSRCQIIRFRPLPDDVLDEVLRERGIEDPAERFRLIRIASGSVGQALALAEQPLWVFRRTVLEALARPPLDSIGLGKTWLTFIEEAGKESAPRRTRLANLLRLLIDALSDALVLSLGGEPKRTGSDDRPLLEALAGRLGPEGLSDMVERVIQADIQNE